MKQTLQLKVSQQLALTPQLQQSIRLLQMSTLELDQELERVLAENPLVDRLDEPLHADLRIAPNGGLDSDRRADAAGETTAPPDGGDTATAAPESAYEERADDTDWGADAPHGPRGDDAEERDYPQLAAASRSLREHLMDQLAGTGCTRRDRGLVQALIDELDDYGYLQATLEEVLQILPEELEVEPEELATALSLLQSFDPLGVGARSVSECLQLQLAALGAAAYHPSGANGSVVSQRLLEIAGLIVDEHLELLANRDYTRLKRLLRCNDATVREAHALIRRLDPRPGRQFLNDEAPYVVPDVLVRHVRGGWTVELNPEVVPKLQVNDAYARILRGNRGAGALTSQLQEARWLVKNVQQRFDTILRVSRAIVERQKAFFTHGAVAMRPLVLREIAEVLDLHESTISRVTTQKYMLTPHGTFELKYFFGSHVATETGGAASSTAIRAVIKQILTEENPKKPLSDSRIAAILGEQGFVVARRTVAKYREALRIPPVSLRRAI